MVIATYIPTDCYDWNYQIVVSISVIGTTHTKIQIFVRCTCNKWYPTYWEINRAIPQIEHGSPIPLIGICTSTDRPRQTVAVSNAHNGLHIWVKLISKRYIQTPIKFGTDIEPLSSSIRRVSSMRCTWNVVVRKTWLVWQSWFKPISGKRKQCRLGK